jgi:class 3 adenylate cyclase
MVSCEVVDDAPFPKPIVVHDVSYTKARSSNNIQCDLPDDESSSVDNDFSERHQYEAQDSENPTNGAENLVKNEAKAVRLLRVIVIGLLVMATVLTGIFTYRIEIKYQIDTFTRDFEALAERFVTQFESGLGSYLYQSYTLGNAISGGLYTGVKPNFPQVTLSDFDNLATSLRVQARALDVIWSPLLKNESERSSWESYAVNSSSTSGQNPPCYVCGQGNELLNLNNQVDVPGLGLITCQLGQQIALTGFVTPSECPVAMALGQSACGCKESSINKTQQEELNWNVSDGIFRLENGTAVPDRGPKPFSPVWQFSPKAAGQDAVMFNQMSDPRRRKAIIAMMQHNIPVFSESFEPTTNAFYKILQTPAATNGIVGILFFPVYESSQSDIIAGSLAIDFSWKILFELGLTAESDGIVVVLENSCGQVFTFQVMGNQVEFLGEGDLHDTSFDSLVVQSSVNDFLRMVSSISPRGELQNVSSNWGCAYNVRLYPSMRIRSRYLTKKPWVEALVVVSIFLFTSLVFLLYDFILRRLQAKVVNSAKRSEAIVSSLFPAVVRDRLYGPESAGQGSPPQGGTPHSKISKNKPLRPGNSLMNHKIRLKTFLAEPTSQDANQASDPIADLFPNTTILFADIAGFTAWSSQREPAQVFKLLETIYGAFDKAAMKRGVFKIETIGDCYVAVAGLPEPREDHAVVMVKFAFECLLKMGELTKNLESTLGPGTADLAIRVGLHSGPVIGGVLRGERARFQLFGDTMNTASRMESNSKVDHIHVSKETAELLIKAGKSDWVEQRAEMVSVKGKGEMQTYWVKPSKPKQRKASISLSEDAPSSSGHNVDTLWGGTNLDSALTLTSSLNRRDRLIAWNADILEQFLQKLIARRKAAMRSQSSRRLQSINVKRRPEMKSQVVDEITVIITMPSFNEQTVNTETDPTLIDIGMKARSQLRDYVAHIAALYHDNAFHNFEHASHVVMSASKLLQRIITPHTVDYRADESGKTFKSHSVLSKEIHETSFGISSDPLMQFAVVFAALIHDVDHTGLQNTQLVKKKDPLAVSYLGKCVAEQHSIQVAWHILMEERFVDLRRCIFQTEEDRQRFRQLVVNAVIATDIADKDLQTWRQKRWDKAFHEQQSDGSTMDRKATLLFEYILQTSDIAPTMQHWHVYQKWNQRLFEERYIPFVLGNDEEDPSLKWYEGELAFFDNYVIPLARNLEESNVFGVSCDDYLAYALENRREWEVKGKQLVTEMVASHRSLIAASGSENCMKDEMFF